MSDIFPKDDPLSEIVISSLAHVENVLAAKQELLIVLGRVAHEKRICDESLSRIVPVLRAIGVPVREIAGVLEVSPQTIINRYPVNK